MQSGFYADGINTRACGATVAAGAGGTASASSSLLCKGVCDAGSIVNVTNFELVSQCSICPAGTSSYFGTLTSCTRCDKNFFSAEGAKQCTPCPVGGYTITDGSTESDCFSVPPGYYLLGETWRRCEVGYFCVGGSRNATAPGYYTDREGSVQPEPCPRGRYITSSASSSCTACPLGRFANATTSGATSLLDGCPNLCPAGRYGSWTGQWLGAVACQFTCGESFRWGGELKEEEESRTSALTHSYLSDPDPDRPRIVPRQKWPIEQ